MILEKYVFKATTSGTLRQTVNILNDEFPDSESMEKIRDIILKTTDEIYTQKPYQNQIISHFVEFTIGCLTAKTSTEEKSKNL